MALEQVEEMSEQVGADAMIDTLFAQTEKGFEAIKELALEQGRLLEQLKGEVENLKGKVLEVDTLKSQVIDLRQKLSDLESRGRDG